VAEADFFLKKLKEAGFDLFAVRCYTNAFTTAARSVTYAIQAVMCHQ
jgi:uroporphyrinogen-III synthase